MFFFIKLRIDTLLLVYRKCFVERHRERVTVKVRVRMELVKKQTSKQLTDHVTQYRKQRKQAYRRFVNGIKWSERGKSLEVQEQCLCKVDHVSSDSLTMSHVKHEPLVYRVFCGRKR